LLWRKYFRINFGNEENEKNTVNSSTAIKYRSRSSSIRTIKSIGDMHLYHPDHFDQPAGNVARMENGPEKCMNAHLKMEYYTYR